MDRQQGNLSGSPYFETRSFTTRTHNDTRFVSWESRHHKLSENTKFAQIWHRELGQPEAEKMMKINWSTWKLPTTAIQCTTFAHSVFLILTMSFRKICAFSKRATSSTIRFFQFAKSLSKFTGIHVGKLGKIILNGENSPTTLLPRVEVFYTKVRQGQFRWKVDNASFP